MKALIEQIEIVLTFLMVVVIIFIVYRFYRKVRLARMGPPKRREFITYDKSQMIADKKQVIGMINCEYCGALMSQTATFCPSCGAPRKK
jgi:hypothetical protein